jgi:peptidoglycan/xylan/chitin deacetylase (PgdA/CDA1 family)
MSPITLCYHDVVPDGEFDRSGFPGPDAATYKLPLGLFRAHLQAVAGAQRRECGDEMGSLGKGPRPLLTFDDGGASSLLIAAELEKAGRRGAFFIPTDLIGSAGFLDECHIRSLHRRGHVIGSHSCSHRGRMSRQTRERLDREWGGSVKILSEILETPIEAASVPSGYYSPAVADAAACAGIRYLFTQEPVTRIIRMPGCTVIGRYTVRRWTTAQTVAALAAGHAGPRLRQWFLWKAKKAAKTAGGEAYTVLRRQAFALWRKVAAS